MALLDHAPTFSAQEASDLASRYFGIRATASPLPSERDQNFRLVGDSCAQYVLKIANALEDRGMLEAQNEAMSTLSSQGLVCPRVYAAPDGETIVEVRSPTGTRHWMRLVSYVPGIPMGELLRHSDALLVDLGRRVGQFDRGLAGLYHPSAHRKFHWDLAQALPVIGEYRTLVDDPALLAVVDRLVADYERDVVPLLPSLPKSVIHSDANDYNVIVGGQGDLETRGQRVAAIIDFGDMVYSYTVGGLAIAIAYAVLDKPDPLAAAVQVVRGYHRERPLQENEIAALYGLVCMRLCTSVCMAAYQRQQRADDPYLDISQGPIRATLPRLAAIHPRFARAAFRQACDLPPDAHGEAVVRWLAQQRGTFASVLGHRSPQITTIDLSIGSPLVSSLSEANACEPLSQRICDTMATAGAEVGMGRYGEARMLYRDPLFEDPSGERRTVHLGVDLFCRDGTPVYAPLAGTVHCCGINDAPQDYGPLIVLAHETDCGQAFYTLYGHLSASSVAGLSEGMPVDKGQLIGAVGSPDVNGGWPAHLHVQVIIDLLDLGRDFPGVCRASEYETWSIFSPDPNLILELPDRLVAPAPTKAQTLQARRQRLGGNLSIGYQEPVKVERGWMQYLYDETGRQFLDAYNNVPHVGHCHPRVVHAGQQQMAVLNTNTRYLHDTLTQYAAKLCATLPDPLSVCYFCNSGSEANELALRLSRAYTGQRDTIVLESAYHGNTTSLIDISPYKHDGPGGTGAPDWVHTVPIADVYRGPYKADDPQAGTKYASHVRQVAASLHEQGRGLACYIAESCPSVGGQILFPEGYLSAVYEHVRAAGGLCIADEVQTGYGRIGTHFYGFEGQGIVPDIVVLGKPIGNGHPIGAVVTRPEIAAAFDNGMEFFSTFGGNTVSCAIGCTVLDVVLQEGLQQHALEVGQHMLAGLRTFLDRYSIVGDVRGSGLFLGVELVRDRETLEPAGEEASYVANRMRERGVLLGTDGPYHNVVKIRPPMPFARADADRLVAAMDASLADLEQVRRLGAGELPGGDCC